MTDEEAGYVAENLWLYRVRRRLSRDALSAKIVPPQTYRDYEYGTDIPSHAEVAQFAKRLQTTPSALTQQPDYKWLIKNYRVRKVLELFCLLQNKKQRHAVLELLRGLQTR
ncbi:MAG: helix-turn-helix transcriptional regulator [Alphaproteobacteria bacterium]|nr:helix-turn-helix transcriptional regulator [Alphaproteobacteria bacterium]